jgi:hypothetical protein
MVLKSFLEGCRHLLEPNVHFSVFLRFSLIQFFGPGILKCVDPELIRIRSIASNFLLIFKKTLQFSMLFSSYYGIL